MTLKRQKVLLADDFEPVRRAFVRYLESVGFECDPVSNGAEAVEAYRECCYALVILDCQMPVMDGYEAAREIRQHEKATGRERTPLLAVSAAPDQALCMSSGMDDVAMKPLSADEFETIVFRYLVRQPSRTPS